MKIKGNMSQQIEGKRDMKKAATDNNRLTYLAIFA
jgi:hypothetical protein